MNPSIRSILNFVLVVIISQVAWSQQSYFSLSLIDSTGKSIPDNKYMDLQGKNTTLQLQFKRNKTDKSEYEIYVVSFNENSREVKVLIPVSSGARVHSTIKSKDSALIIKLVGLDFEKPDSTHLAVFVATGFNTFYSTLDNLADTSWEKYSWRKPRRDSLFSSFMRFMSSDLAVLPALDEMQKDIEMKTANLQPVESDLEFAKDCRKGGLVFKQRISFYNSETDRKLLSSYVYINPRESYMGMSWTRPAGFMMRPGKKSELDELIEDAAAKHLKLINFRGSEPKATDYLKFSLKELVETLEQWPNQVGLLLYSLDEAGLHVLYADNAKKVDTILIPVNKERLQELAEQLQYQLLPGSIAVKSRGLGTRSNTKPRALDSLSRVISRLLLPSKFNLSKLDHLVIIPSFNIATIPFAMLPVTDSLLLIDRMSYSIVPSINEFIITGQIRKKHYDDLDRSLFTIKDDSVYWSFDRRFLFVGAPSANTIGKYKFAALPGAKMEIQELSKKVGSPVILMDQNATRKKVKEAIPKADVIYFATHAIADAKDPLNKSFILLSGKGDSALLTAKEIQQLDLRASLVVLSACETGLGKSHEGGMIGLSRAFEIAGAKNVLMSLWPVSDSKTPKLMQYFFEALENNGNGHVLFPHEAFRTAVLRFKKEEKNPVYWAAFSLFGVPL
jgi:CHAT domain-containing protein